MSSVQIPKGVFDILPHYSKEPWKESHLWHYVEESIRKLATSYAYGEIRTPIFEKTELFQRSVGEVSEIVSKEMYTFEDKAKRSMTLKPEGTASVMRAYVEKQMHLLGPIQKLYYISPMFRYERQQAGRYRQHHQFGAECIGDPSPERDVELIAMLYQLYQSLGLKNLNLYINSVGSQRSRKRYNQVFEKYIDTCYESLSEFSKIRAKKNPLRILDSKEACDQEIIQNAPSILDYLEEDEQHFNDVCEVLDSIKIDYSVCPRLVRGLDYYTHTVFEITSGSLGAQNTIGGGGRYDNLLSFLGGPSKPAVGFGTGLERLIQTMIAQNASYPKRTSAFLLIIPLGKEARKKAMDLQKTLREKYISLEVLFHFKKLKQALKASDNLKPHFRLILGDDEIKNDQYEILNLQTRQKHSTQYSKLLTHIETLFHNNS